MHMNRHICNDTHTRVESSIYLSYCFEWNACTECCGEQVEFQIVLLYVQAEPCKAIPSIVFDGIYHKMQCLYLVLSDWNQIASPKYALYEMLKQSERVRSEQSIWYTAWHIWWHLYVFSTLFSPNSFQFFLHATSLSSVVAVVDAMRWDISRIEIIWWRCEHICGSCGRLKIENPKIHSAVADTCEFQCTWGNATFVWIGEKYLQPVHGIFSLFCNNFHKFDSIVALHP